MRPAFPPFSSRLAAALIALLVAASGCLAEAPEPEGWGSLPRNDAEPSADADPAVGLGTPFVLDAIARPESLAQIVTELVQPDGTRVPVATRSVSFELRSDGHYAAIDHVRVILEPLEAHTPFALANRASTVLTVLDSSPDYVRAAAGQDWSVEASTSEPRSSTSDEVPVSVLLEAKAEGSHVRLTMTLESSAEFPLGDTKVSTGPWVVQLEGELEAR